LGAGTNAKDIRMNRPETRLKRLEATLRQKDDYITKDRGPVAGKKDYPINIHRSRGWKVLLTYYKLRDKILGR
jgi:hypothetical protein